MHASQWTQHVIRFGFRSLTAPRPRALATQDASRMMNPRAQEVLDFWFGPGWEAAPPSDSFPARSKVWFQGGPEVDAEITQRFGGLCEGLLRRELDGWQAEGATTALAAILVGDQMFRNAFRGTAKMYAADPKVLPWTKALVVSAVRSCRLHPPNASLPLLALRSAGQRPRQGADPDPAHVARPAVHAL